MPQDLKNNKRLLKHIHSFGWVWRMFIDMFSLNRQFVIVHCTAILILFNSDMFKKRLYDRVECILFVVLNLLRIRSEMFYCKTKMRGRIADRTRMGIKQRNPGTNRNALFIIYSKNISKNVFRKEKHCGRRFVSICP